MEHPSSIFNRELRDSKLKYNVMEKKAYALVKTLKGFIVYVLHSHAITYVRNAVVKDILTQPDLDGRRGRWIVVLLGYDL